MHLLDLNVQFETVKRLQSNIKPPNSPRVIPSFTLHGRLTLFSKSMLNNGGTRVT